MMPIQKPRIFKEKKKIGNGFGTILKKNNLKKISE